jgi:DNA-binding transcriptional MerR regulator
MAMDHESRQRAEELFVIDGRTIDEVADIIGVSSRTVSNWSTEGGWLERRREYRNAASDIRRYATLTRLKLIKDAMTSLDPQKVYAFAALERVAAHSAEGMAQSDPEIADVDISTPSEAIAALQEAIEHKLGLMLGQPDALNLVAIKELKQMMELVDGMKKKYGEQDEEKGPRLLTQDEIKSIREQM